MRVCEACQREVITTEHHLIPRSQHKRGVVCRQFSKQEMRTRKAMLCLPCHRQVHRLFTERELALQYNTIESLVNTDSMQTFLGWIRKQRISGQPRPTPFLRA